MEIRLVGPDDDLTQELDLRVRAFGPIPSEHYDNLLAAVQSAFACRPFMIDSF